MKIFQHAVKFYLIYIHLDNAWAKGLGAKRLGGETARGETVWWRNDSDSTGNRQHAPNKPKTTRPKRAHNCDDWDDRAIVCNSRNLRIHSDSQGIDARMYTIYNQTLIFNFFIRYTGPD